MVAVTTHQGEPAPYDQQIIPCTVSGSQVVIRPMTPHQATPMMREQNKDRFVASAWATPNLFVNPQEPLYHKVAACHMII